MTKFKSLIVAIIAIGTILVAATPNTQAQTRLSNAIKDTATATGSATAGSVTLNKRSGIITTTSSTNAVQTAYALTISNSTVKNGANSVVLAWVLNGTNSGGAPTIGTITGSSGQLIINVVNGGTSAFNGTLKVGFLILDAS
jgi:hypothetical protein